MKTTLLSLLLLCLMGLCQSVAPLPPFRYKLIIFEGSDWCVNCRKLEREVLRDSLFISELGLNAIQLEIIDFPQRKKLSKEAQAYNNAIAERYEFDGSFPTLILARVDTFHFQKMTYTEQTAEVLLSQVRSAIDLLR